MKSVDRDMQTRNLAALAKSLGGFKFSETFFPYTSGEIGSYYVQSASIMADGNAYAQACKDMAGLLAHVTEGRYGNAIISGGESRDWVFSFPVAQMLNLPHFMIYKDGKTLGANVNGKNVIHVADLNNEGSSPRDLWVPVIRQEGGKITQILFYVDRLEDGAKVMKELELQSNAVIPLDEYAWDFLQKEKVITQDVYKSLCQRMEDKDVWARTMLRSEKGLETLANLLNFVEKKNAEKGLKILNKGYPDMKKELIKLMDSKKLLWPGVSRDLDSGVW